MSMTVKQLAEELGVSKPTISKAITDLGLQGNLHKIGNRFILEDSEIDAIKSQILQTPRPPEPQETETATEKQSEKSETDTEKTLISLLESQITILQEQLSVKDAQIATLGKSLQDTTAALTAAQDALQSTTAALTAAQALHAGTIQQQLADKQVVSEGQPEDVSESVSEPEQPEQQGFFKRIFRR